MLVYEGTKEDFVDQVFNDSIAGTIESKVLEKLGRHTPESEKRSWQNSMQYMYKVMMDNRIPADSGIAIEYGIPQTSKRVDFMISGYDEKNKPSLVLVELKQWESAESIDSQDGLVRTYLNGGIRTVVHPSYQVWSYKYLLEDLNKFVQDEDMTIASCAFLHNYDAKAPEPLLEKQYKEYTSEAPVFFKGGAPGLRDYIHDFIKKGDGKSLLTNMDVSQLYPSKSLQNVIVSSLKGNQEFVMIDEQKVAYEGILKLARESRISNKKVTIIVQGGPGTGKTVIAVNLLARAILDNTAAVYASRNSAPRKVYSEKLKGQQGSTRLKNLFKGTGSFISSPKNQYDMILTDEAHRLNEKSGLYGNAGNNQIQEIIHAARCSVFFIDDHQRVTLKDIGSTAEIIHWAEQEKSEVFQFQLVSQFRCNGSNGYLSWVDYVLGIDDSARPDLNDLEYDIRIFDDPQTLYEEIVQKNRENHNSRMLAGYCWNWISEGRGNSDVHDIKIGDFEMSWNLDRGTFALDQTSIHEIGCIHTSQGLEFEYIGLIIGDDLRFENGQIITDVSKRASTDQSVKGIKKMQKNDPDRAAALSDEIIRNTYRTLMTRGMKGCYIYCTDPALGNYLKEKSMKR